ncbi:hypothetical protein R5W24_003995 [Gemmata sp. JC717]|uniref:Uncharacterized protein n=1 Tax=Gemmata algarum TaxID=2975278 RepID=A0ABU5EXY1_9BACT|nr:hypothetical protein [Gemmata algarum]MDY3554865.1 hypothetical protein [Gemmata algarum]MDY3559985.1 hypothetical protein [Gemmata algarum]
MFLFGLNEAEVSAEYTKRVIVTILVAATTSGTTFVFTWWWARRQAKRQWKAKEFLDRLTISLNIFADGTLKIRTVMERSIDEIFLNRLAIQKVWAAARATTPANPILPIPKADRWFLLNFVLNAVAGHFVEGHIRLDAGLPVASVRYALFLTCEHLGEERIRKVRAMLVRCDVLEDFPHPDTMPRLESPWHDDRIRTLRVASALYKAEPDNFLTVEVCV